MDDFTNLAELAKVTQKSPVLVIIEQHVLARTCILNILKRELTGFEIVEMATTSGLSWFSGRDIRLIALNIGDKEITDPSIEVSLALLAEFCPKAYVALLSNRDDEATISAAMQRGSGFFSEHRFRSRSPSPDCAWFLPAGSTGHCRSSGKMERRASYRDTSACPSYPNIHEGNGVHQNHAGERQWSILRPENNMCSRRCSSAFPTS